MAKRTWNIHDIKNRWLRGLAAWVLLPLALAIVLVLILVEAIHAGGEAFLEIARDRWGETRRDIIKPNVRTILFRRPA